MIRKLIAPISAIIAVIGTIAALSGNLVKMETSMRELIAPPQPSIAVRDVLVGQSIDFDTPADPTAIESPKKILVGVEIYMTVVNSGSGRAKHCRSEIVLQSKDGPPRSIYSLAFIKHVEDTTYEFVPQKWDASGTTDIAANSQNKMAWMTVIPRQQFRKNASIRIDCDGLITSLVPVTLHDPSDRFHLWPPDDKSRDPLSKSEIK